MGQFYFGDSTQRWVNIQPALTEIKWTNVSRYGEPFYKDLIDGFFQRSWLMFHAVIVRRGYTDKSFHKNFDEEKRKRFTMLIQRKIAHFCAGDRSKRYHVWVDLGLPP